MIVLRDGVFGMWLGHVGGALRNGISALTGDTTELCVPEESFHPTKLTPWSWISSHQNCEEQIPAVYQPPNLRYSDAAAWTN